NEKPPGNGLISQGRRGRRLPNLSSDLPILIPSLRFAWPPPHFEECGASEVSLEGVDGTTARRTASGEVVTAPPRPAAYSLSRRRRKPRSPCGMKITMAV